MALLDAWREGSMDAGDELFQRYYDSIVRFFRNKVDEQEVKDLVQQTFIGCAEGRERIQGEMGFRPYLFGVAHNVFRNYLKHKGRVSREQDFEALSIADLAAGPKSLVARRQEHRLLLEALRAIPVESQIILELRFWEQLKSSEIAEILNIPHGTARSRLRRAQQQLHAAMSRLAASTKLLESTLASLSSWAVECRAMLDDA